MAELALSEAVPLGYALAARVACDAGVRALGIKGPTLGLLGLRESSHVSSDVDLLVEPGASDRLVEALAAAGWAPRADLVRTRLLGAHSTNLVHPAWPCEIDVHTRYPGFESEPLTVFDLLWERRVRLEVAGSTIDACDRVGGAAVAALHYLRDPVHQAAHLEDLMERLEASFSQDDRAALGEVAMRGGASYTLAPVLRHLGIAARRGWAPGLAAWEVNARSHQRAVLLANDLLTAGPRRWHRVVLDSLQPAGATGGTAGTGGTGGTDPVPRSRWLLDGLVALPRAVATVVAIRFRLAWTRLRATVRRR